MEIEHKAEWNRFFSRLWYVMPKHLRDLSAEKFGERYGYSKETIHKWMRGAASPGADSLADINSWMIEWGVPSDLRLWVLIYSKKKDEIIPPPTHSSDPVSTSGFHKNFDESGE